jgi:hypothetical protein
MNLNVHGMVKRVSYKKQLIEFYPRHGGLPMWLDIFTGIKGHRKLKVEDKCKILEIISNARGLLQVDGYFYNSNILIADWYNFNDSQKLISDFLNGLKKHKE